MLIYGSDLENRSILSLHTGYPIAQINSAIINPYNLNIIAFNLKGARLDQPDDSYLLVSSIREISPIGFIVDSSDEIINSNDVIKLKEILNLNFNLIGLKVISKDGAKLGRVSNFIINISSMTIEQLVVNRPVLKALLDPELIIHRSKIIDISNEQITVKAEKETPKSKQKVLDPMSAVEDFVNPFRKEPKPEINSSNQIK